MKKIGEYTVRGRLAPNQTQRINLFDGRWDTAYRIKTFEIATDNPSASGADASMIASTEDTVTSNDWDWRDNTQKPGRRMAISRRDTTNRKLCRWHTRLGGNTHEEDRRIHS